MKWTVCAVLLLLTLLVAGCGSRQPDSLKPGTPSRPALPPADYVAPIQAQRSAAADSFTLLGDESVQYSTGADPDPGSHTMWLLASTDASEWALYSFSGLAGGDTPAQVGITLSDDLPEFYWVGLGDYAIEAWRWVEVEPEGADGVDVRGLSQPVSAGGAFHVVVLAYGAEPARIAQLTLYVNLPPLPPTDVVAEPGAQSGQYVLSWSRADTATGYEVYRDSQLEAVDTVGDVDTWTDAEAGEQDRTYWLKATNEHGASDFSEPAYGRTSPWQIQLIDPDGRYSTSLAVVDGKPVIAYVAAVLDENDDAHHYPRFARATTATPQSAADWVITEWSDWGDQVNYTRTPWVTTVEGKPAFTISDRYYRALTAAPSNRDDWEIHCFDEQGNVQGIATLIQYFGSPHLAYIDDELDALRFARGKLPIPSAGTDWEISTIDKLGDPYPRDCRLAVIAGLPAVCFARNSRIGEVGNLYYSKATTLLPYGSGDWQTHVVDDIPEYPAGTEDPDLISLADGKPAICYLETYSTYMGLKFARAVVVSPSATADWVTHTVQGDFPDFGSGTSMRLVDGKPAICYYDGEALKYAAAQVAAPSAAGDWTIETLFVGDVWAYKCLRLIDGQPQISFGTKDGLYLLTRRGQ